MNELCPSWFDRATNQSRFDSFIIYILHTYKSKRTNFLIINKMTQNVSKCSNNFSSKLTFSVIGNILLLKLPILHMKVKMSKQN